jgi:hypothetical protein
MPKYIIAYHGAPKFESPEQGATHMAKWKAWVSDLGDAIVNPGTPLSKSKLISSRGVSDVGPNLLTGFSMVMADSIESAIEIAQRCPYLDHGGTVEVAEVMEMK